MAAMPGHQAFELADASTSHAAAMPPDESDDADARHARLHKRTLLKLDCLLLPFLALLFLFNAVDKANIGNAESAHFSADIGLDRSNVNTAVALFFAFFVTLQPVGAALGRRYGMVAWVPSCMLLWGMCTALHAWVQHRWQLYTLRIIIGCLEAGFYAVTVTYLSLFYTRFEFGRRLSLFYGQSAVGGALGGIVSYFVFSHFRDDSTKPETGTKWRPWQVMFLVEGTSTIIVAMTGYFWLPHNIETAWFLTPEERRYASLRIARDRNVQNTPTATPTTSVPENDEEGDYDEESRGLLNPSKHTALAEDRSALNDRGLTPHDILSAILSTKIYHILFINILSAVPVAAFSIFLPLVLAPLTKTANPDPALINLLTTPPHVCGAITLYLFARYSDKHRIRLVPVLYGLGIMVLGLAGVIALPATWAIPRYLALCVLLSGAYVASPLTVVWISGNTPAPGKRAILLGINGWGNLAGIVSAMLYRPKYEASGYIVPFWWTLACVAVSAVGYVFFIRRLKGENESRKRLLSRWNDEDIERERSEGWGPLSQDYEWLKRAIDVLGGNTRLAWLKDWVGEATRSGREGDERMTFVYGL